MIKELILVIKILIKVVTEVMTKLCGNKKKGIGDY